MPSFLACFLSSMKLRPCKNAAEMSQVSISKSLLVDMKDATRC